MNKPQVFKSFKDFVYAVELSMPDEYPSGMAEAIAQDMIDRGKVIIDGAEKIE